MTRCRVPHCWKLAVENDLCLAHGAEAYEHASHGCPDEDVGCLICDESPTLQAEAQQLESEIETERQKWEKVYALSAGFVESES